MFDPAQPVSVTNCPPGVTVAGLPALAELQNHANAQAQMEREAAMNGGAAPEGELTQKQRVEASFLAGNIHRK